MQVRLVHDASSVLALLQREAGWKMMIDLVEQSSVISLVNWIEVIQRLQADGAHFEVDALVTQLASSGIQLTDLSFEIATRAARLREPTRSLGLSMADRVALATAERLGVPVVTADRTWSEIDLGVEVVLIR